MVVENVEGNILTICAVVFVLSCALEELNWAWFENRFGAQLGLQMMLKSSTIRLSDFRFFETCLFLVAFLLFLYPRACLLQFF